MRLGLTSAGGARGRVQCSPAFSAQSPKGRPGSLLLVTHDPGRTRGGARAESAHQPHCPVPAREEGGNPGQVLPLGSGSESLEGPRLARVCAPHGRGPRGRRVHSRDESGEARQLHDILPITEVFIFALKILIFLYRGLWHLSLALS